MSSVLKLGRQRQNVLCASAMATALESMFGNDPHAVEVSRSEDTNDMTLVWTVTFSSHLDELYPDISSPGIMVLPAVDVPFHIGSHTRAYRTASVVHVRDKVV